MEALLNRRIKRAMRVAIVVPQFAYPLTGGVGPHARKIAESMSAEGDDIIVISDGISRALGGYEVASVGPRWSITAALRAISIARKFKADAVIFEYTTFNFGGKSLAPLIIALAMRVIGLRQAAYVHEIFYPASSRAVRTPYHAAFFAFRDLLFAVLVGRLIVANGEKRLRLLRISRILSPTAVTVIPIGANIEPSGDALWDRSRSDGRTILSFGVVMPRRRFEIIIDAAAVLIASGYDLTVRIVGNIFDEAYADRCRSLAESHGIADRVELTGALDDDLVSAAFRAAAIFGYALEDGLISSSGTLLAALAHGIPIVATTSPWDDPDLRSSVAPTDATAQSFAAVIIRVLADRDEQLRLAAVGRGTYDRRFQWTTIVKKLRAALK